MIITAAPAANPQNALSAVVTLISRGADSARIVVSAASDPGFATPFVAVRDSTARIVVLGLRPNTAYQLVMEAAGAGGSAASPSVTFQTGDLPAPLRDVRLATTGIPPSGYILTEVTLDTIGYVVAFDSAGRVAWYRPFPLRSGEIAVDATQQPNGNFTVFIGISTGWQPAYGRYYEFTPDGTIVATYAAGPPYYTDPHELLLEQGDGARGHVHLIGYDMRQLDLTALGGRPDQLVAGHTIVRQSAAGAVEFLWNAWDHFSIADWLFIQPGLAQLPSIDFDHPNSLDVDANGDYIVSFASLGEITKIDGVTGSIRWRFGGRNNQFRIIGDPLAGFGPQHDVRRLPNGDITFMDNGARHSPPESRAVEFRLDTTAMTATLVWQHRSSPPLFSPFAGSVERLSDGGTVITYGALAFLVGLTPDGTATWDGHVTVGGRPVPYLYRAWLLPSLYRYERP